MPTQTEEQQAREFLKRAEIRTMKKDLRALREVDALKERDKIAKLKTLEEQLELDKSRRHFDEPATISPKASLGGEQDIEGLKKILERNAAEEKIAEKDLKNYTTEQERQQIFLLESERLNFEKQVDLIDKEKEPALKLEKNNLLLRARDAQTKLNSVLEQEKKLEGEQKFIAEKSEVSTFPAERKSLEQSRWDIEKKIQDTEKKRWEAEKQIQNLENRVSQIDKSSEQNTKEKNSLRDRILGIDKSLREIYSAVIAREEEKREGRAKEQTAQKQALAKTRSEEREAVRREQRDGLASLRSGLVVPKKPDKSPLGHFDGPAAIPPKADLGGKLAKSFESEEEQRKKFLKDIEEQTK